MRNIFYTHDRPLLWRFLNVTLTDTDSGRDIIINQSEDNLFQYVSYVHDLPGGIRVSLSIDILYFITSSWKSVLFWILTALILLNMVRMHFRLYQNVSRENISDAMTGLYNRKILTPELEQRLQKLVQSGSSVMFIAIDMDKLKLINDTLGHQEGDLAITLLAQAIKQSIRKVIMPSDSVAMNSASFLSIRRRKLQHNCLNVSKNVCNISRRRKKSASLPVFTR